MKIVLKTNTNQFELEIEENETIQNLKEKISKLEGQPPVKQQQLFYLEKLLEDSTTLSTYTFQPNLVLTLRVQSTANKCKHEGCTRRVAPIYGNCKFCSQNFCAQYRLPETHSCSNLKDCRQQSFEKNKEKLMKEKCVAVKV